MSITELGALGEFVGAFGVIASLVYLGLQVRQVKKGAEREAASQLIRSCQNAEFTRVMNDVFNLPEGLNRSELEERFEGQMDDLLAYFATWESLGVLVHRRQLELGLVSDLLSYPVIYSWKVARVYVEDFRTDSGRATVWEWFQWLAERMMAQVLASTRVPGYIVFGDWKD